MMRRSGRFRLVLTSWLEEQITALVELAPEAFATRPKIHFNCVKNVLRLFREAAFSLHVEEHFSRNKT